MPGAQGDDVSGKWHIPVNESWLALHTEETLEPELAIIDAHHHLWDRPGHPYLLKEFLDDANTGHRIRATVFVQCRAMYRTDGDADFQPIGETEFVNGMAAMSASGGYGDTRVAAGIVSHADLMSERAGDILRAHMAVAPDRFRGIRYISAWDADQGLMNPAYMPPRHLLSDSAFRRGFAHLYPLGLSFDAWLYHPQLDELFELACAFPDTRIIVNHLGGPLNIGAYAGRHDEVFAAWSSSIKKLAQCDNVYMKLGGLGMRTAGFDLFERHQPATSSELAELWRPYMDLCIEAFGAQRCMFESNFPVDKVACSYVVLWNAFKRIAQGASAHEKKQLFHDTAAQAYRISLPG